MRAPAADLALAPLLAALDGAAAHDALDAMRMTDVLRAHAADADALHQVDRRLAALMNAPLARVQAMPPGAQTPWSVAAELARIYVEQYGWTTVEVNAAAWIKASISQAERTGALFADPRGASDDAQLGTILQGACDLLRVVLDVAMGAESHAHPEYFRVVASPQLSAVSHIAMELAERAGARLPGAAYAASVASLLGAIAAQLELHANTFRPLAPRLHALCQALLFAPYRTLEAAAEAASSGAPEGSVRRAATRLLAALHLTGAVSESRSESTSESSGGRVSQAQLWLATANELTDAAGFALRTALPSLSADGVPARAGAFNWEPPAPDADFEAAIRGGLARLELLLGGVEATSHMGILPQFLLEPTPRLVPVPLDALVRLAHAALAARLDPSGVAMDQARVERAVLPHVHILGVRLLVQLVAAFHTATWQALLAPTRNVLGDVCALAERSASASPERTAALRALEVLLAPGALTDAGGAPLGGCGLPLDPMAPLVLRAARLGVQNVCAFVAQGAAVDAATAETVSAPSAKRARLFESDSVFLSSRAAQDAILRKTPAEIAACQSGAHVLVATFPVLAASGHAGSGDLSRVAVLGLLGVCEVLIDARLLVLRGGAAADSPLLVLAVAATESLATLLTSNKGALLAHALPRSVAVLRRGIQSPVPMLRAACDSALARVLLVVRPRVPPLLDTVVPLPDGDAPVPARAVRTGVEAETEAEALADAVPPVALPKAPSATRQDEGMKAAKGGAPPHEAAEHARPLAVAEAASAEDGQRVADGTAEDDAGVQAAGEEAKVAETEPGQAHDTKGAAAPHDTEIAAAVAASAPTVPSPAVPAQQLAAKQAAAQAPPAQPAPVLPDDLADSDDEAMPELDVQHSDEEA